MLGAAGAILVLALAWIEPDALEVGRAASWDLFYRLTGIPCPGCGLTRSLAHLAHGDIAASLRLHPLGGLLFLQTALAWSLWGVQLARRPARPILTERRLALWALANAAALLVVWLARLATFTLPV